MIGRLDMAGFALLLLQGCVTDGGGEVSSVYAPSNMTSAEIVAAFETHCVNTFPDMEAARSSLAEAGYSQRTISDGGSTEYVEATAKSGDAVFLFGDLVGAIDIGVIEPPLQMDYARNPRQLSCQIRAFPADPENFEAAVLTLRSAARPIVLDSDAQSRGWVGSVVADGLTAAFRGYPIHEVSARFDNYSPTPECLGRGNCQFFQPATLEIGFDL